MSGEIHGNLWPVWKLKKGGRVVQLLYLEVF